MGKPKGKIMMIDDDPDYQEAMASFLESAGYQVTSASNIEKGKEKILRENPDLILLDMMMDGFWDGFSLFYSIKKEKEFKNFRKTPIIFVSAVKEKAGARIQFRYKDYGLPDPEDYFDKPFSPEKLISRIEELLKKKNH